MLGEKREPREQSLQEPFVDGDQRRSGRGPLEPQGDLDLAARDVPGKHAAQDRFEVDLVFADLHGDVEETMVDAARDDLRGPLFAEAPLRPAEAGHAPDRHGRASAASSFSTKNCMSCSLR